MSCGKQLMYVIVLRHRVDGHYCAYLNIDKWIWDHRIAGFESKFDVTYQGIGSTELGIPPRVGAVMPILTNNYWVGIDYFQKPEPEIREILTRIYEMAADFFMVEEEDVSA